MWSNTGYLISVMHLFTSKAVTNLILKNIFLPLLNVFLSVISSAWMPQVLKYNLQLFNLKPDFLDVPNGYLVNQYPGWHYN